jgi:DNA-binding NarL/FixJ family response regulator
MTTPPRYVVGSVTQAAALARALRRDGWQIHEGFVLPDRTWDVSANRTVLVGLVDDAAAAADAVLAAARGAGLVVTVEDSTELAAILRADLERIGPLATAPAAAPAADRATQLTAEQCALLDRLAGGDSIAAAAEAEFLSLRTANRRIAQARAVLGVRTTRQAVVEYVRRRG